MCGIAGYLRRGEAGAAEAEVGPVLLRMLEALGRRGPDSAGAALYGAGDPDGLILRVKLSEERPLEEQQAPIVDAVRRLTAVRDVDVQGASLRLVVENHVALPELSATVEGAGTDLELLSAGHKLELVKQVGAPRGLDDVYRIGRFRGTHGIGHTRLSTESRVDLSHSQPFWARGVADLAVVHNGHITNYHKLRRRYERAGARFYTENDSEIIGLYLARRMSEGFSLEEAMRASVTDLDGTFCYLVAWENGIGFAKDFFASKPLMVSEADDHVAIATEQIALHAAFPGDTRIWEPGVKEVRVWSID
jgi:methylamine---glutamate N-methyltransferase subunit A